MGDDEVIGIVEGISAYNEKFKNRGVKLDTEERWINTPGMSREDTIQLLINIKKGDKAKLYLNSGGKITKAEAIKISKISKAPPTDRSVFIASETARLTDAMKISHDAITTSCSGIIKHLKDINAGAILEAIQHTGVSVYIEMNKRGI